MAGGEERKATTVRMTSKVKDGARAGVRNGRRKYTKVDEMTTVTVTTAIVVWSVGLLYYNDDVNILIYRSDKFTKSPLQ